MSTGVTATEHAMFMASDPMIPAGAAVYFDDLSRERIMAVANRAWPQSWPDGAVPVPDDRPKEFAQQLADKACSPEDNLHIESLRKLGCHQMARIVARGKVAEWMKREHKMGKISLENAAMMLGHKVTGFFSADAVMAITWENLSICRQGHSKMWMPLVSNARNMLTQAGEVQVRDPDMLKVPMPRSVADKVAEVRDMFDFFVAVAPKDALKEMEKRIDPVLLGVIEWGPNDYDYYFVAKWD